MSTKTCSQTRAIQARRIFPFDVNMHNTLFGGNLTRIIDDHAMAHKNAEIFSSLYNTATAKGIHNAIAQATANLPSK